MMSNSVKINERKSAKIATERSCCWWWWWRRDGLQVDCLQFASDHIARLLSFEFSDSIHQTVYLMRTIVSAARYCWTEVTRSVPVSVLRASWLWVISPWSQREDWIGLGAGLSWHYLLAEWDRLSVWIAEVNDNRTEKPQPHPPFRHLIMFIQHYEFIFRYSTI